MKTILGGVQRFMRCEGGPTATEYAILLAVIILACWVAIAAVGSKVDEAFTALHDRIPDQN